MAYVRDNGDNGFDLSTAISCADTYSRSVGVGVTIIDSGGRILYSTEKDRKVCSLCCEINSGKNGAQSCSSTYLLYGSYQAERFGGKYIFFCPLGLAHWASPITADGSMRGAILGGPAMLLEPDDFLIDDIINKFDVSEDIHKRLREYINEAPVIKTEKANSLADLLYIVASYLSTPDSDYYADAKEQMEQQSDISEYVQHIKTVGDAGECGTYPLEKEKELMSLISIGDKANSQRVLNEIFGHIFFSSGGNFEVIKSRVLELIVLLSRAALEGGADIEQIFGLNYRYLSQIHKFETVEELTYWLSKIMARFTDCVFNLVDVKHVDVIYRAISYIRQNYMKKITLEEVASHVYLSPSYFSKIFKDEMKCNFNEYLNHVRIEMSKKLLMDPGVPLVDVSSLVGYEDQSYFSKVFKKITGVSPGKYRETRGNLRKA